MIGRRGHAAVAGASVALALAACAAPPRDARPPSRTVVEGLTYSEFAGETLARRIRADQLLLVPKRLGVFRIAALTELVLTRARVEVFEAPGGGTGAAAGAIAMDAVVPTSGFAIPGMANVRHFAGATVYGLEVVVVRGAEPVARIEAAHASADVRSGNLALRDVRMTHLASRRTVTASRATWRRRGDDFVIPGDYELTEDGRTRTGRGLRLDARLAPVDAR